jgi:hypothetical protein
MDTNQDHPDRKADEGAEVHASRRRFVGTVAAGIAAAPALAQAGAPPAAAPPRSLTPPPYPGPPFPRQKQDWPGLAGKMTPRPDHGETTYRGSGRLAGRRALITGGDSGIGRAVAIAFAREGADVAIGYLPAEELDAREVVALIRQAGRNAVALPGDIRDEAFCKKMVEQAVRQLGGLDILVNNAARQQSIDSILDLTTMELDWHFKTNLYALFWITKGRGAAPAAGVEHHHDGLGTGLRSIAEPAGLFADQGGPGGLHQVAGQAAGGQGDTRERGRSRTGVDAAAGDRRPDPEQSGKIWRGFADEAPGPAGRTGAGLCRAGGQRRELHHRPGVWRGRRRRQSLSRLYLA